MELLVAALGAVVGALATYAFALRAQRRHDRYTTTTELVSTFLAPQFLAHRRAVYQLGENVLTGKTTPEAVAAGFQFPITKVYYVGPDVDGVNLHVHLTAYLGWCMRVGYALRSRSADVRGLQSQLSDELAWGAWAVMQITDAIKAQAAADARQVPDWIALVDKTYEELRVNSTEPPVARELVEQLQHLKEQSSPMTWALLTWPSVRRRWPWRCER